MPEDTRKAAWLGLEETLSSAISHLGTYLRYAERFKIPTALPDIDPDDLEKLNEIEDAEWFEGYGVLEHVMECLDATYAAMEDGDIVENKLALDDWKYEVANGDTKLGYAEWLQHRQEAARYD